MQNTLKTQRNQVVGVQFGRGRRLKIALICIVLFFRATNGFLRRRPITVDSSTPVRQTACCLGLSHEIYETHARPRGWQQSDPSRGGGCFSCSFTPSNPNFPPLDKMFRPLFLALHVILCAWRKVNYYHARPHFHKIFFHRIGLANY